MKSNQISPSSSSESSIEDLDESLGGIGTMNEQSPPKFVVSPSKSKFATKSSTKSTLFAKPPTKSQKSPTKSQKSPTKSQKSPTKSQKSPTKGTTTRSVTEGLVTTEYVGDKPVTKVEKFPSGQLKSAEWYNLNGQLHNDGYPALITWYENGRLKSEAWYQNGKLHRLNDPAMISWYDNGLKMYEAWIENGVLKEQKDYNTDYLVSKLSSKVKGKPGMTKAPSFTDKPISTTNPISILISDDNQPIISSNQLINNQDPNRVVTNGLVTTEYKNNKPVKETELYPTGKLKEKRWLDDDGRIHRDQGPAVEMYDSDGNREEMAWYKHGVKHRDPSLPAVIRFYKNKALKKEAKRSESFWNNGRLVGESWYDMKGDLDNKNGPALIKWYMNGNKEEEMWFQEGKLDRKQTGIGAGPAVTKWYQHGTRKEEMWYKNDFLHRNGFAPAITEWYENGQKKSEFWYKDGRQIDKKIYQNNQPQSNVGLSSGPAAVKWNPLSNPQSGIIGLSSSPAAMKWNNNGNQSNNPLSGPQSKTTAQWAPSTSTNFAKSIITPFAAFAESKRLGKADDEITSDELWKQWENTSPKTKKTYEKLAKEQNKQNTREKFFPNGQIEERLFYDENQNLIRRSVWHVNGEPALDVFYRNGEMHTDDDTPAFTQWFDNGVVSSRIYYKYGQKHRENKFGPAVIDFDHNGNLIKETWMKNDKIHNTRGPAIIMYNGNGTIHSEYYYENGKPIENKNELKLSVKNPKSILRQSYASNHILEPQIKYVQNLDDYSLDFLYRYTQNYYKLENRKRQVDKLIENIFKQIPPTTKAFKVYRGVRTFPYDNERNFISTSSDQLIAHKFVATGCCLLVINVKEGSKVIPLKDISYYPEEEEILLHGNGIFTIKQERVTDSGIVVQEPKSKTKTKVSKSISASVKGNVSGYVMKKYYIDYFYPGEMNALEYLRIITFNLGARIQMNKEEGTEREFVKQCKAVYPNNGLSDITDGMNTMSQCSWNAAEWLASQNAGLIGLQEVVEEYLPLFITAFDNRYNYLGHNSGYIIYDQNLLGKGILLSDENIELGGKYRPMVIVWFPTCKLLAVNLHAEHNIPLKTQITRTFDGVMKQQDVVKEDQVERIIVMGDFNDTKGSLHSLHLFGLTLKQHSNIYPATCCSDSNYKYHGDYIFDSDFNLVGNYSTPPTGEHPYAMGEKRWVKLNENKLMSDHDPVAFFPGL